MKLIYAILFFVGNSYAAVHNRQCDTTFPDGSACDPSAEGVTKADPTACFQYNICISGCVITHTCDLNMVYDELYFMCRDKSEVDCGERPCNDPSHCEEHTTTTEHGDCTPPEQWINCTGAGLYPDPFNCRRWWSCKSSHDHAPEHHICENDNDGHPMMYDLRYKGCNYDYLTDCGSRPVCDECNDNCGATNPQTTATPTDTPCGHEFDCHGKPNGYYPDPYSCERFIVCEGGFAFPEYCPPGLFYDPALNQCGWPWEVMCGSRPPCDECMGEC